MWHNAGVRNWVLGSLWLEPALEAENSAHQTIGLGRLDPLSRLQSTAAYSKVALFWRFTKSKPESKVHAIGAVGTGAGSKDSVLVWSGGAGVLAICSYDLSRLPMRWYASCLANRERL